MPNKKHLGRHLLWAVILLFYTICPVFGSNLKALRGHVPGIVAKLTPRGRVAPTNELQLAIGLPMRDPAGLDAFLAQIYNPASPHFRQFLTPEEIAARFGPTTNDYEAVKHFARTNGLTVTGGFNNRLVLDVTGPAAAIERAFHITLRTYRHPTEARDFFAPDTEPSVDANLPVADVQGLSDYARPQPRFHRVPAPKNRSAHKDGSAPDNSGAYFGDDVRKAYAPDSTLTGAGQSVGLFEADGFYANDIAAYAAAAGNMRANIIIQTVKLDNFNGLPTPAGSSEVSLDIEQAMAMAPGLARIVVFEGNPNNYKPNDILNSMLANNTVKSLSCSWGWNGGPSTTTDNIFKNMQAAGQTFFDAAGDSDAFTAGAGSINGVDNPTTFNAPADSPYTTQVGGTTLTMNGTGASYNSETVWNWDVEFGSGYDGQGSSGGVSSYYAIPGWQANVSGLVGAGGSTSFRNMPDVAAIGDNVYVADNNGSSEELGGTSCGAPVWAGLIAMANQQAVAAGKPVIGFVNPALYAIASGSNYGACFHDVTTGNNTWSGSPNQFYAGTGYDLCSGLGTPAGQSLINALADSGAGTGPGGTLTIFPLAGAAAGVAGGPFTISTGNFQLTNSSSSPTAWSLINTSSWLKISPTSGTLAAGASTSLTFKFTAAASRLVVGTDTASLIFSNRTSHVVQPVSFTLAVGQPLLISPPTGFTASGPVGGPFNVTSQSYVLTNLSSRSLAWKILNSPAWLSLSPSKGSLGGNRHVTVTASLNNTAKSLSIGVYSANLFVTNFAGLAASLSFTNNVGQSVAGAISVNSVPPPGLNTIPQPSPGFSCTWKVMSGQSYQFQYTTNLAEPDWINLGGPVSTSDGKLLMQDTNPMTASPSRFYRMVEEP